MEFGERANQPSVIENLKRGLFSENPKQFVNGLQTSHGNSINPSDLRKVASDIEFVDKAIGYDPDTLTIRAFNGGTLIGRYLVDLLHPNDIKFKARVSQKINEILRWSYTITNHIEDAYDRRFAHAQTLLNFGWKGCDEYPEFTDLIEYIEDSLIDDAAKSTYIRPGMGFVLYAMHQAEKEQSEVDLSRDLHSLNTDISLIERGENEIDWDAALEIWQNEIDLN